MPAEEDTALLMLSATDSLCYSTVMAMHEEDPCMIDAEACSRHF